uniref:C3H1-type domain-containing protein n=1 Tax=Romanomermis culicivorax TaxID=13658 RepID=A0A915IKI1_ROMCU
MSNQRGTTQRSWATPFEEIRLLQSEIAWLTAPVARLTAQQRAPPLRNPMPSMIPLMRVQNAGDCPSGAHLQMCSYHERCTHNDANCQAQHPDSAIPSNATATAAAVVSAPTPLSAFLPPPPKYATLVNVNPSMTLKTTCKVSVIASYRPTEVDTIPHSVEEASRNARPTAVVAASPSMTTTGAQTLAVIAPQQPVTNTFGETLPAVNDDVSIIEASPFRTAPASQSPKIGVLRKVHPWGGLVIDFPGEDPVSSDNDDKE